MAERHAIHWVALGIACLAMLSGCGQRDAVPPPYQPSIYATEKLEEALRRSNEGDVREALRLANDAMADDPLFPAARYWKSAFLVRLGHFEDARVTLLGLFEIAPRHPEGRMLYGLLLEKVDLILEARASYEIAATVYGERLEGGQDNPANHLEHAIAVYLHRGKLVGLQTISAVLKRFPDYQPAQFVRSRISADDRDYFLRQAIQSNRRIALDGNLPLPVGEAADTALSNELLEPLTMPENQRTGETEDAP